MKALQLTLFEAFHAFLILKGILVQPGLTGDFVVRLRRLLRVLQPHAEDFELGRKRILEEEPHQIEGNEIHFDNPAGMDRFLSVVQMTADCLLQPLMEADFDRKGIVVSYGDLEALEKYGLLELDGKEN